MTNKYFKNKKWLLILPLLFFLLLTACKPTTVDYTVSLDSSNFETIYALNEDINLSGLIIKRTYKSGEVLDIVVKKSMVDGFDSSQVGDKTIVITYEGKTFNLGIEIVAERVDQRDLGITNARNLIIGEELQLAYTISSGTGVASVLKWSSSNPSVANVSNSGLVRAWASGFTTITLSIVGTSKFVSVDIIVGANQEDIIPSIAFVYSKIDLLIGETAVLAPVLKNITNPSLVTFSSDSSTVVSISGNTATANAVGTAVVTAALSTDTKVRAYLIFEVYEATIKLTVDILGKKYFQVNQNATLIAVERPYNIDAEVVWSSSDTNKATISSEGVVRPIEKGIVDITAVLIRDSNISCTYRIYVNDISTVEMSISAATNTVANEEKLQLNVGFSSPYYSEIRWISTNPNLASINSSGLLTAISGGDLVVLAYAGYEDEFSATYVVTITGDVVKPIITISGASSTIVGDAVILQASVSMGVADFIWSSSNPFVATVVNGVVYGMAVGQVSIIVSLRSDPSVFLVHNVLIASANSSETICISGFNEVVVSKTIILHAICSVEESISWATSNKSVATVSPLGVVTGVSAGVVQILAFLTNDPTLITSYEVVVFADAGDLTQKIIVDAQTSVELGEQLQLTYTLNFIDENVVIIWSSSDDAIASVDQNGLLEACTVGSVTITVSIRDSSIFDEININVSDVPLSISLVGTETNIAVGASTAAVVSVSPKNATYSFSSSDTDIATVNSAGIITGIAGGFAVITVMLDSDNNVKDTFEVYIVPAYITLLSPTSYVYIGKSLQLSLLPLDVIVGYSSNHLNMATVSSTGLVSGFSAGSVIITATLLANPAVTSTVTLLVVAAPTITITGPSEVVKSNTINLIAECSEAGVILWSSSDSETALVNDGSVLGLKLGSVTISAWLQADPQVIITHNLEVVLEASLPSGTISITGSNQLIKGEQITLKAECSVVGNISWLTSNSNIAFVNNGVVYGVSAGSVTISSWLTSDPSVMATHSLIILNSGPGTVILINNANNMLTGDTLQLTVTITPANTAAVVLWSSSNPSVIDVDSKGLVTAVASGSGTIYASVEGATTVVGSADITVSEIEIITVSITGTHEVGIGDTITLLASASNNGNISWSSSNTNIAIINNGLVLGVVEGVVNIKATLVSDPSVYATHQLNVVDNTSPAPNVYLTNSRNIFVGEELQLGYVIDPVTPEAVVTWESSNDSIASISLSGLLKGNSLGSLTIYLVVTISGNQTVIPANILVTAAPTPTISLSGLSEVEVGDQITLIASSTGGGTIAWLSSLPNVAYVNNGIVTGVSVGVVVIKAFLVSNSSVFDTIEITVVNNNPIVEEYTIEILNVSEPLKVGATRQLTYLITPENESLVVIWTSDNETIATVDANGLVSAHSSGRVNISAKIEGTTEEAFLAIRVQF